MLRFNMNVYHSVENMYLLLYYNILYSLYSKQMYSQQIIYKKTETIEKQEIT